MIDTSFTNNVRHIRPYLGIILISSMAFGVASILYSAVQELSGVLYAAVPPGMEEVKNELHLATPGVVHYGDTISYTSSVSGNQANQYINTTCFQGSSIVFEKSIKTGATVYLYDEALSDVEWNGKDAECNALLVERLRSSDEISSQVVGSFSFEVKSRGY